MIRIRKRVNLSVIAALVVSLVMGCATTASFASYTPTPQLIDDVEYLGSGKVKVEFEDDVAYKDDVNVAVTSTIDGKAYTANIYRKGLETMRFSVDAYEQGKKYSFVINGVKAYYDADFTTAAGSFTIKKPAALKIKKVDYDRWDRELSFDFRNKVEWQNKRNNMTIIIKSMSGHRYAVRVTDRDNDDLELYVKGGLKYGAKYSYTIKGVKSRDADNFKNISGTFRAIDR